MVHVGIDLHKKTCRLNAFDDATGAVLLDQNVPSEREALLDCLRPLQERGPLRLVLEACGLAGYWSDVLSGVGPVIAVHPKAVRERKPRDKTDRGDAAFLVELSVLNRAERIQSYLGTTAERDVKDLLRYRVGLVRLQTRLRIRLRNIGQRYGRELGAADVDSRKGRRLWESWELRPTHRLVTDQVLELLSELDTRLEAVGARIQAHAAGGVSRAVALLQSLPGVGLFGAMLIVAEIGNWRRFPSGRALANYAGLTPGEDASGPRRRLGPITREGPIYLRWMMVQAALHYPRSPRLKRLYERVVHRSGPMKARVAVAREMLVIAWHMLESDKPYEERRSHPNREKPLASDAGASSEKPEGPLTH